MNIFRDVYNIIAVASLLQENKYIYDTWFDSLLNLKFIFTEVYIISLFNSSLCC